MLRKPELWLSLCWTCWFLLVVLFLKTAGVFPFLAFFLFLYIKANVTCFLFSVFRHIPPPFSRDRNRLSDSHQMTTLRVTLCQWGENRGSTVLLASIRGGRRSCDTTWRIVAIMIDSWWWAEYPRFPATCLNIVFTGEWMH